jgi:hypothetical protein
MKKWKSTNREEFKKHLLEEWNKISAKETEKLVFSMPKRVKAIIDANGY